MIQAIKKRTAVSPNKAHSQRCFRSRARLSAPGRAEDRRSGWKVERAGRRRKRLSMPGFRETGSGSIDASYEESATKGRRKVILSVSLQGIFRRRHRG